MTLVQLLVLVVAAVAVVLTARVTKVHVIAVTRAPLSEVTRALSSPTGAQYVRRYTDTRRPSSATEPKWFKSHLVVHVAHSLTLDSTGFKNQLLQQQLSHQRTQGVHDAVPARRTIQGQPFQRMASVMRHTHDS